jgi:hypothetical protein
MDDEPMGGSEPPAMSGSTPPPTGDGPPVAWEAPKHDERVGSGGSGSLWAKPTSQLTYMDALMTGFRLVTKPAFIVPVLAIGVVTSVIVVALILPLVIGLVVPSEGTVIGGAIIAAALGAIVAALIGGFIVNVYGQLWAVAASRGPEPTMNEGMALVSRRWMNVLGSNVIVGLIALGGLIVVGVVGALLGGIGIVVFLVGFAALAYVGIRLSMAPWLAADGATAVDSVQASWRLTQGRLLRILGWGLVTGIVFGIITSILSAVLTNIPFIGDAITTAISLALSFGAGVTIYRSIKD